MRICAHCSQVQRTCCQDTDVSVTDGDVERIAGFLGRLDFYEFRQPADPEFQLQLQAEEPEWLLYTIRKSGDKQVLKHTPDESCIFLSPEGCELAAEVRPLICKLHPLRYDEEGFKGFFEGCPCNLLESGETLTGSIGIDYVRAEAWRRQLYREMRHGRIYLDNIGNRAA